MEGDGGRWRKEEREREGTEEEEVDEDVHALGEVRSVTVGEEGLCDLHDAVEDREPKRRKGVIEGGTTLKRKLGKRRGEGERETKRN